MVSRQWRGVVLVLLSAVFCVVSRAQERYDLGIPDRWGNASDRFFGGIETPRRSSSATIVLENRHKEPLWLKIVDRQRPGRHTELRIRPGEKWQYGVSQNEPEFLEESYLTRDSWGRPLRRLRRTPLPQQTRYEIAVYAERVTSVYYDSTKKRATVPKSITKSAVSLGVFPLPADGSLRDGAYFDVYREALRRNNPGAAVHFGAPPAVGKVSVGRQF